MKLNENKFQRKCKTHKYTYEKEIFKKFLHFGT